MSADLLKINVGCGSDLREGWLNLDVDVAFLDNRDSWFGDARRMPGVGHGTAGVVLMSHMLHMLTYEDADLALAEAARVLAPGGQLVVVEADVLGVLYWSREWEEADSVQTVRGLISDEVEPTLEGKVLRWACWHGTRRSLWSPRMMLDRLERSGLWRRAGKSRRPWETFHEWAGARADESFVVIAERGEN